MKHLILKTINVYSIVLAVLLMTNTGLAFQSTTFTQGVNLKTRTSNADPSVAIYLSNLQNKPTQVSIQDINGQLLHTDVIENDIGFAKLYDLEGLAEGNYAFKIEQEEYTLLQPFTIAGYLVQVKKDEKQRLLKPTIKIGQGVVDVSAPLDSQTKDLEVTVLDNEHHVVYTDNVRRLSSFKRRYNLQKLDAGTYTLKVMIENQSYYETFVLR